jgi:hypothetical protein
VLIRCSAVGSVQRTGEQVPVDLILGLIAAVATALLG